MNALEMIRVEKRYGNVLALDGLDLTVRQGERVALLGPNGAGKTTAIALLLGLRAPSAGAVQVLGRDPRDLSTHRKVGAMLQETMLPPGLKVRELVDFARALYPSPTALQKLARIASLEEILDRRVERLSGGQRRCVLFAMAMAGQPDLLFLDEPTAGVDAETRQGFWEGLEATLAESNGTLLFTTHYLEEAERYASRVVVIRKSHVAAEGTPQELRAAKGSRTVRFELPAGRSVEELRAIAGASSAQISNGFCTLIADDPDEAVRRLILAGPPLRSLEVRAGSLEDALANMAGED